MDGVDEGHWSNVLESPRECAPYKVQEGFFIYIYFGVFSTGMDIRKHEGCIISCVSLSFIHPGNSILRAGRE